MAAAHPSMSVRQAPWRADVLAVGRFGGGKGGAWEGAVRQTRPTYGPEPGPAAMGGGFEWQFPLVFPVGGWDWYQGITPYI